MEPDEIIYAVGELYLKYRKAQQIIQDQAAKLSAHSDQMAALSDELTGKIKEVEKLERASKRKGRK